MNGKEIPVGVKIIAVLYYIGAVLGVIFGILFLVGAGLIGTVASQIPIIGLFGSGLFVVAGIILIGLGVLGFFMGRGLWKGKNWARILAIIFAGLGVIMAIVAMFTTQIGVNITGQIASQIVNLAINLVIGGYLLFSKKVKAAFS